jgi:hypothetical protein
MYLKYPAWEKDGGGGETWGKGGKAHLQGRRRRTLPHHYPATFQPVGEHPELFINLFKRGWMDVP